IFPLFSCAKKSGQENTPSGTVIIRTDNYTSGLGIASDVQVFLKVVQLADSTDIDGKILKQILEKRYEVSERKINEVLPANIWMKFELFLIKITPQGELPYRGSEYCAESVREKNKLLIHVGEVSNLNITLCDLPPPSSRSISENLSNSLGSQLEDRSSGVKPVTATTTTYKPDCRAYNNDGRTCSDVGSSSEGEISCKWSQTWKCMDGCAKWQRFGC
ncbi:MAG: hypothetical protein HQK54_12750, partial [Oligoflexales bacterium]|nr:hypothetical protein [Oligoflexales bacterium]